MAASGVNDTMRDMMAEVFLSGQHVSVLDTAYAGGAKGDGSTDDSAAFQAAASAAIAGCGVLYIPPPPVSGSYYRVQSLITIATVDAGHNRLKIVFSPLAEVRFNAATGLFKFDGTGGGGGFDGPVVEGHGARVQPYLGQSNSTGYAFWFAGGGRAHIHGLNMQYNAGSVSANTILFDNIFTAWCHHNDIGYGANGPLWANTANGILIFNNDIHNMSGTAAGSGGGGTNEQNGVFGNYFEETGASGTVIATTSSDLYTLIADNWLNHNHCTSDIVIAGAAAVVRHNFWSANTASTNSISAASTAANTKIEGNIWGTDSSISGSAIIIASGASRTSYSGNQIEGSFGSKVSDSGTNTMSGWNMLNTHVAAGVNDLGSPFNITGELAVAKGALIIGDRGNNAGSEISLQNALGGTGSMRCDIYNNQSSAQLQFFVVTDHNGSAVNQIAFFGSDVGRFGCRSSAPATASSGGTAGEMTWDSTSLYVCVATNTWKRVAIATF